MLPPWKNWSTRDVQHAFPRYCISVAKRALQDCSLFQVCNDSCKGDLLPYVMGVHAWGGGKGRGRAGLGQVGRSEARRGGQERGEAGRPGEVGEGRRGQGRAGEGSTVAQCCRGWDDALPAAAS